MKDIDAACKPFESAFREELFDKLYDFFKRYFSESGSIYFCHTPQHANVYEKVYTDEPGRHAFFGKPICSITLKPTIYSTVLM